MLEVRKNGSANPLEEWVWDQRYIDAPVLRWHDSNTDGTVDDTLYACNDANMNGTALVDASTGHVVERFAYDPYGENRQNSRRCRAVGMLRILRYFATVRLASVSPCSLSLATMSSSFSGACLSS